jgi:hypothetical protein
MKFPLEPHLKRVGSAIPKLAILNPNYMVLGNTPKFGGKDYALPSHLGVI